MLFGGADGAADAAHFSRPPAMSSRSAIPSSNFAKISGLFHAQDHLLTSGITFMQAAAYGATMFGSAAINNIW
jgi:hypothetical protein